MIQYWIKTRMFSIVEKIKFLFVIGEYWRGLMYYNDVFIGKSFRERFKGLKRKYSVMRYDDKKILKINFLHTAYSERILINKKPFGYWKVNYFF